MSRSQTYVERIADQAKLEPAQVIAVLRAIHETGPAGPMIAAGAREATAARSSSLHTNNPIRIIAGFQGAILGALEEYDSVIRARARALVGFTRAGK